MKELGNLSKYEASTEHAEWFAEMKRVIVSEHNSTDTAVKQAKNFMSMIEKIIPSLN